MKNKTINTKKHLFINTKLKNLTKNTFIITSLILSIQNSLAMDENERSSIMPTKTNNALNTSRTEDLWKNEILPMQGLIFVLSGPCGAGKTTSAMTWAKGDDSLVYSRSITSRKPRKIEENYDYVNKKEFIQMIKEKKFAQWVHPSHGEYYGTPKAPLEDALTSGKDVVVDYCPEGYLNLRRLYPKNVVGIFIMAPSFEVLRDRLINRGTETDEELVIRYNMALKDFNFVDTHKYHIINQDLEKTLETLKCIRVAEKSKLKRQKNVLPLYKKNAEEAFLRYY